MTIKRHEPSKILSSAVEANLADPRILVEIMVTAVK